MLFGRAVSNPLGINSLVPAVNQTDITPGSLADFVINWLRERPSGLLNKWKNTCFFFKFILYHDQKTCYYFINYHTPNVSTLSCHPQGAW